MQKERDNVLYLCNYDVQILDQGHDFIKKLWSGDWTLDNSELCKELLASGLETDALISIINGYQHNPEALDQILYVAISAFLSFCDLNWNAHATKALYDYFELDWPKDVDAAVKLQRDSEPLHVNISSPELLYFSSQLFSTLYSVEQTLIHLWWCLRCKVTHQRALEDTSATLFTELEFIIAKLSNMAQTIKNPRLKVLLYAEIAQAYLIYARIEKVEDYLLRARELAGLKLELTGILGKRTKFQQNALPQLALSSELDSNMERSSAEETHGHSQLPTEIELQDDVRLNKIQFHEQISQAELPSLEQTLCLLTVQYMMKSRPRDELMREEVQPYLEAVLSQGSGPWATRAAALLLRSRLEATHKRTVERAMLQCETIVNDNTTVSPTNRLSYLWASGLAPAWTWRQQLADLYLSLGLVKAALEEYQRLQLWEDVVVCYTMLQLRHKATEVIQQQIDIKPTVKLYCLLGDATDDVSQYETAWEFSNCKSSRAQRHWGNFLFERKKYEECIPHYEKSVEINSLQEVVWLRLGYAALEAEQWEVSARAYRRYTCLQPNTFEAWNNLAKVYVQQGDKRRAYRALCEALKFNYDNWKLWENFILVSMDTGHLEDVMRGAHRLLDLRRRFDDLEVLLLLVRAVLSDTPDADGNGAGRLRKRALELFGHITSIHQNNPDIWQLYSDLSPTYLLKAQRLQKAYKGFTQSGSWPSNPETCKKVMELAQLLMEYSLKASKEVEDKERVQATQQLSSARLTGQAVIRAAEKQQWPDTQSLLQELKLLIDDLTEYIKSEL